MSDWADEAAHYLVGDIPWSFVAGWARDMPKDVAAALRAAASGPLPSGTDKAPWRAVARSLVKRLHNFVEPEEISEIEIMIVGALIAAAVGNRVATPMGA